MNSLDDQSTHRRRRRTPITWVRGGGLTTLLFLLPLLLVFGAFSWYPIVRTVIMSLQHTNLVQPATWVGLDNFRAVLNDPLLPIAVKNTSWFAGLALDLRLSRAARRRRADERGAALPRHLQRARLPSGRDPAGGRGAPLEDVLRRELDRRLQHGARLGRT